jgi:hypothetical protein
LFYTFLFIKNPSTGQAKKFTEYNINNKAFGKIFLEFFRNLRIVGFGVECLVWLLAIHGTPFWTM